MNIVVRYLVNGLEKRTSERDNEDFTLNVTRDGERFRAVLTAKRPLTLVTVSFKKTYQYRKDDQIFLNGYQSWTDTREFSPNEQVHSIERLPGALKKRFHFDRYGDSWFWQYHRDSMHSFTYSYVRRASGKADFIGSLNDENAWLIIHHKVKENEMSIRSDVDGRVVTDSFVLYDFVAYSGDVQENLKKYFSNFGPCTAPPIRGYTSWYLDYQDISESSMREALSGIDSNSFDLFQIDDGYETFVGDWMDIDAMKFPEGLAGLVDEIHAKGLKAGIWLAPFVCETKSRLYAEHPDWLCKKDGEIIFAGCNWSGDAALDVTKPEVQEYLRKCLTFYKDMGFDFFKLDFLYAAVFSHKEGSGLTRAEVVRRAMEGLRAILGDKLILGCGVPLSSAFGLVDYCRIGPDVSLRFDDVPYMRLMHRERISTKVTLQNTIYRSAMDGSVFRCDPDVFLLRDDHISLSKEQRRALVMLNHLCGSVYMTSDKVGEYDDEKRALLAEAQALSGAEIKDIQKNGRQITICYEKDGNEEKLVYDSQKGVLIHG